MPRWFAPFALFVLGLLFLGSSNLFIEDLQDKRDEYQFSATSSLEGVPPEIAVATTALGAFRGIIVDILWIRAEDLKEKEEFFELVQLWDWIGILQPRLEKVWAFSAWNMAYNVSVELPSPQERWNWVSQGLYVLRKKGIPYNPEAAALYEELAWIYYHKVGGTTDDHNRYYKIQLAVSIDEALQGESAKSIVAGLESEDTAVKAKAQAKADAIMKAMDMDVTFMAELEEKFGPFDWRFPDSVAIYWLEKGRPFAKKSGVRTLNFDRKVYSSLQNIFKRGRMFFIRNDAGQVVDFYTSPNFPFAESVLQRFDDTIEEHGRSTGVISAYRYFMEDIFALHISYNNTAGAQGVLKRLRENFPNQKKYKRNYKYIVHDMYKEAVKEADQDELYNYLLGSLTTAFVRLGMGDEDMFIAAQQKANFMHKFFNDEFKSKGSALPPLKDIYQNAYRQARYILGRYGQHYQRSLDLHINPDGKQPQPGEGVLLPKNT